MNFHPRDSSLATDVGENVNKATVKSSFWGWEQSAEKARENCNKKKKGGYLGHGKINKHP